MIMRPFLPVRRLIHTEGVLVVFFKFLKYGRDIVILPIFAYFRISQVRLAVFAFCFR